MSGLVRRWIAAQYSHNIWRVFFVVSTSNPFNYNRPSKVRAGRILGRVHTALGQHSLAVAAFESALSVASTGRYLLTEALAIQARAVAGKAAGGAGGHWNEETGLERLAEVTGRMWADDRALIEKALALAPTEGQTPAV